MKTHTKDEWKKSALHEVAEEFRILRAKAALADKVALRFEVKRYLATSLQYDIDGDWWRNWFARYDALKETNDGNSA